MDLHWMSVFSVIRSPFSCQRELQPSTTFHVLLRRDIIPRLYRLCLIDGLKYLSQDEATLFWGFNQT